MLISNIDSHLETPAYFDEAVQVEGGYLYFHYLVDGFDDRGWGCAYRSLQTLASWCVFSAITANKNFVSLSEAYEVIPSIPELEAITRRFNGIAEGENHQWIGSVEVYSTLDILYQVPCTILSYSGDERVFHVKFAEIIQKLQFHFSDRGPKSPVMMGGASGRALTIAGIGSVRGPLEDTTVKSQKVITSCRDAQYFLLILDPHLVLQSCDNEENGSNGINSKSRNPELHFVSGGVEWIPAKHVFIPNQFFNLCLPQRQALPETLDSLDKNQCIEKLEKQTKQSAEKVWDIELIS